MLHQIEKYFIPNTKNFTSQIWNFIQNHISFTPNTKNFTPNIENFTQNNKNFTPILHQTFFLHQTRRILYQIRNILHQTDGTFGISY